MSSVPSDNAKYTTTNSMHTGVDVLVITASANALSRPVRALRAEGAGNITITTLAGNSRVLYFKDGETRYVGATHVTAISGVTTLEGIV